MTGGMKYLLFYTFTNLQGSQTLESIYINFKIAFVTTKVIQIIPFVRNLSFFTFRSLYGSTGS